MKQAVTYPALGSYPGAEAMRAITWLAFMELEMSTTNPKILAIGAAGQFAGLVVPELKKRGATVRGFVRDAEHAAIARKLGAAEIAIGDLADAASLEAALKGIDAIFYIAPATLRNETEIGIRVVEAATAAGVGRFVFSSLIHPELAAIPHHIAKIPVEAALVSSGMQFALLHPAMFFQNYAGAWAGVAQSGVLAEPWSTDTRFSRVDYRDVAEVAAIALTEDQLLNGTFELCAEGDHNRHDVARLIGDVLGRPVEAKKLDLKQMGAPASPMQPMFDWYDKHGLLGNSLTLRSILEREPRSLKTYFEELAAAARQAA